MTKHGTNRGWLAGCREKCCRRARKSFLLGRNRSGFRMRNPVPVDEVREHLKNSVDNGIFLPELSDILGISQHTLKKYKDGISKTVDRDTAQKILSVNPDRVDRVRYTDNSSRRISSIGAQRRVRAMAWMGWSLEAQARLAGSSNKQFCQKTLSQEYVTVRKHRKIDEIFRYTLLHKVPQGRVANSTRTIARKRGWHGPGAWSDIDDPDCVPETGRLRRGKPT